MNPQQIEKTFRIATEIMGWREAEFYPTFTDNPTTCITAVFGDKNPDRTLAGPVEEAEASFQRISGVKYSIKWQYWNPFDFHWPEVVEKLRNDNRTVEIAWSKENIICRINGMARDKKDVIRTIIAYAFAQTPGEAVSEACIRFLTEIEQLQ